MASEFDLVIRNGTIADGRGGEPFSGDVAITAGKVAAVGKVDGSGIDEIDANGMLVTPGFVDIHTHYDAQLAWDPLLLPSSNHGVTTVVTGNCGVGFAPCQPSDRELLMSLMEGIEDIPRAAMVEGLPWTWESFPEFLDFLDTRPCAVDFASHVPHGAVRVSAMGDRAVKREPATAADIDLMARTVSEAVEAGAIGFSTARSLKHRTIEGELSPEATAGEEELTGIAQGLGQIGKGVLQFLDDFHMTTEEASPGFAMWRRIAASSGRPTSFSLIQPHSAPDEWRHILKFAQEANDGGLRLRGQVSSRAIGSLYGLELSGHPFMKTPSYLAIAGLPHDELIRAMATPDVRARIVSEEPSFNMGRGRVIGEMFELGDPPDYSPSPDSSLAARAGRDGMSTAELAYDLLLASGGTGMLYFPAANFADRNLDVALEMMKHDSTVIGLGDGGAHVARTCDASIPSHLLTYWTRDRVGEQLSVGTAIRMITQETARAVGFLDRGELTPGMIGDVNIIDYDHLQLRAPTARRDLPTGATRLVQPVDGYVATIKAGHVTFRDGESTGALPGNLIRGPQPAPA
jgi:N-acyl-D-amino-acid deacylase